MTEIEKLKKENLLVWKLFHDFIAGNQAAWIEWKNGRGAKAAMQWVENGLSGPGHIPNSNDKYYNNAQLFFNANQSDPLPICPCGNPSSILWMGNGYYSEAHQQMHRDSLEHKAKGHTDEIISRITG